MKQSHQAVVTLSHWDTLVEHIPVASPRPGIHAGRDPKNS